MRALCLFLTIAFVGPAAAAAVDHGITDIRDIPLSDTINEVQDFTPDGRAARIVKAYDNSAWLYLVMVQAKADDTGGGNGWNVVSHRDRGAQLIAPIIDAPHVGEDYVRSIRFAHAKLDGETATLLVIAERNIAGPIPDPAPVTYSVYRLETELGAFDGEIETFRLDRSWDSAAKFCNSETAISAEFGVSLSIYASGLRQSDGC